MPTSELPDVIFVAMEDWEGVWRRFQPLCHGMARRHPERKFIFVGLTRDVSNRLRRGRILDLAGPTSFRPDGYDNLIVVRPLKLLPNTLPAGRRLNELLYRRAVRHAAAELGLKSPVLWINPHYANHLVGQMGESGVVYDVGDDWTASNQSPRLLKVIREQDRDLCRRADAVVVVSRHLLELKRLMVRQISLVPNGVDLDRYAAALGDDGSTGVAETLDWKQPVFGYTGTIHPERVDIPLVRRLARETGGTVVLVGPNHAPPDAFAGLPNILTPGPVPQPDLPRLMRGFDVCIVPHVVSPFTESLNPIKLWEYLAAGLPTVSTDVAGFRDFPHLVHVAPDADEFILLARRLAAEGDGLADARRAEAANHGWDRRLDQVEAILASVVSGHATRTSDGAGPVAHGAVPA